jgi:hypothetical protein
LSRKAAEFFPETTGRFPQRGKDVRRRRRTGRLLSAGSGGSIR